MTDKDYTKLLLGHIGIGFSIYLFPFIAKIYAILIILIGLYFVIKNKNKNREVLYAAAYIVGSEVFLRATHANPFHEFGKYFVLLFILIGLFYDGLPKKKSPYWIFLVLLIPGIILSLTSMDSDIRRKIFFDIFGPICLGICSLYTYKKKITTQELNNILLAVGLPLVSFCTFLLLKYPLSETIIENTESQVFLSGDYAPNQVATALGLGIFIFFLRVFFTSATHSILFINTIILGCIYYRGLMTFSRGGIITGMVMIFTLLIFIVINKKDFAPIKLKLSLISLLFPLVFVLVSCQTEGLLAKRYANQNPSGQFKSNEKNGRFDLALEDISHFMNHPIMGIGVGKIKEIRKTEYKKSISSHNEITRMLAEHGILGIICILILILTPLSLFMKDKENIYLLCFLVFWLLTINHSGMRVAAPSFIYALALLSLKKEAEISSV